MDKRFLIETLGLLGQCYMQLVKLSNAVNVLQDGVAELREELADEDKYRRRRRRRVVSSGIIQRKRFWVRPMFLRRKKFGKFFHIL